MPCRVLLADDHRLVRQGLRALLEKSGDFVIYEAADGREACRLARKHVPDVAVLDLAMPVMDGLQALREIRAGAAPIRTIILSMYCDPPYVAQAMRAGADGYVLKSEAAGDLIRAIREARRGRRHLSPGVKFSMRTMRRRRSRSRS
jgi:DNA-binding NarL/FixJ family response regulator